MSKFRLIYILTSLIVFSLVLIFVSYAFLESQATNSSIAGEIYEAQVEFNGSDDVVISDIGPVLDYRDGVLVEFSINNSGGISYSSGTFDVKLDIDSLSSNVLLCEDLKYKVLKSNDNVDYTEIGSGNFDNYSVGGNNLMIGDSELLYGTIYYRVYIYMDGTKPNSVNLMGITLEGKVLVDIYVTGRQNLPQLVDGETFNSYIDDAITSIVFTDIEAPEGATLMGVKSKTIEPKSVTFMDFKVSNNADLVDVVETSENVIIDVSKDGDGSVVSWVDGTTMYVSSQKSGIDIMATDCYKMFSDKSNLTSIDFAKFDTSLVTNMSEMFYDCNKLINVDVSGFNTSNVIDMSEMFYYCMVLTSLDVSGFNTSNVTNMARMFYSCSGLTELDVSGFDTSNVTSMSDMFCACNKILQLNVSGFDTSNVTDIAGMFYGCSGLTELDVSGFNTSNVTGMGYMFYGCRGLTSIDVSGFNTSKVTDMSHMFSNCSGLTELDVSGFNTSKVTDMSHMFSKCTVLTELDVSGFDTSKVTSTSNMFWRCYVLEVIDVSGFDTSKVTDMSEMFRDCNKVKELDVSGFNTINVTSMGYMFSGCRELSFLALEGFDTSNVTNMRYMFNYAVKLKAEISIKGNVTSYEYMFNAAATSEGAEIVVNYIPATLSIVNAMINTKVSTSNVILGEQLPQMIDGSTFNSYISNTTTSIIFTDVTAPTGVTTTDVSLNGDGSVVSWMDGTTMYVSSQISGMDIMIASCYRMFYGKNNLVSIDLSMLNTISTTMMEMFSGCSNLTNIEFGNYFGTAGVTNMSYMFSGCSGLTSLNLSSFKVDNVTNMSYMFSGCSGLTSLNLSSFDVFGVTNMSYMFNNCSNLTNLVLDEWFAMDVYFVENMDSMFNNCSKLSLDCSNWDVSSVTAYNSFNDGASGVEAPTWVN